jgi:hypothetical protein
MRPHDATAQPLTAGRVARFWLPLEATWLMMAAEGPFVAALTAGYAAGVAVLAARSGIIHPTA